MEVPKSTESFYIESDYEYLPGLFASLNDVLAENKAYYESNSSGKKADSFSQCFQDLLDVTAKTLKLLLEVAAVSPLFDYDVNIKGNGYRSIVRVVEICFRRLHALGKDFQENRERLLFRGDHYYKELVSYLELSKGLFKFLEFAQLLLRWSVGSDLFPPEDCSEAVTLTEIHLQAMEKECFYGRRLGFYFNTALRSFLTTVSISMASFGDGYTKHDGSFTIAAAALLNGPKYLINPDLRAKKLMSLINLVDMEFCKAFWSLTESYGFQHFPLVVSSALRKNVMFEIPPEPLEITLNGGSTVLFEPPSSWIGYAPVNVHLLSYLLREGQNINSDGTVQKGSKTKPKAEGLIIHIHGGGFVAQSSKSHELYLRTWAKTLDVPILSINYGLAPELPFPRALEECLFAYVWALKNFDRLGTTGRYVALVGDSAGGNLSISMCLKAASYGIRLPDGILASYAPLNVQFRPSPSRLLCLLDPLLPVGILTQCLAAYTGVYKPPQKGSEHTGNSPGASVPNDSREGSPSGGVPAENGSVKNYDDANGPCSHDVNFRIGGDECSNDGSNTEHTVSDSTVKPPLIHSASEFDLAHCNTSHVDVTRSRSDTNLQDQVNDDVATDHPIQANISSCGVLTDDRVTLAGRNCFLSPLNATDEQLALLPPIDLLACSLDPLFDDSIEFAKRLRAVKNKVELYVVDDLPHGFLNFYMLSQEGREANDLCMACIKKILQGKRNALAAEASPVY